MKINLKQDEIIIALKNYIAQQGIVLEGKDVAIDFTSGRKSKGISADISIMESDDMPDFDSDVDAVIPTLTVVPAFAPAPDVVELLDPEVMEPEVTSKDPVEVGLDETKDASTVKTNSLFG